jgi:hypothetical protein
MRTAWDPRGASQNQAAPSLLTPAVNSVSHREAAGLEARPPSDTCPRPQRRVLHSPGSPPWQCARNVSASDDLAFALGLPQGRTSRWRPNNDGAWSRASVKGALAFVPVRSLCEPEIGEQEVHAHAVTRDLPPLQHGHQASRLVLAGRGSFRARVYCRRRCSCLEATALLRMAGSASCCRGSSD